MKRIILLSLLLTFLSSCTILYRAVRYGGEDIDDYQIFPAYDFNENQTKFYFKTKENSHFDTIDINWKYKDVVYNNLDSLLEESSTRAFLVIQNDSVIYEKYLRGYTKSDISTVFSVSKSVTSLLVGIAIDEGYISDVNVPVTKYIPELNSADPLFRKLTVKNLLDMRSGLKFNESYKFNPFAKIARLYYGRNQLALVKKLHFDYELGAKYEYQSISTTILGLVIEGATNQSLAKYFEDKIWKPLEMENTAKWSLDDKKHQSAKAFGGLSISAIDLAKIGRLYINGGKFKETQIVSESWIKETLTPNVSNEGYQNQWYSFSGLGADSTGNKYFNDSITALKVWEDRYAKKYSFHKIVKVEKSDFNRKYQKKYWTFESDYNWRLEIFTEQLYALGIMKQILFIDPQKNVIIVRLGDSRDFDNYVSFMYKIDKTL